MQVRPPQPAVYVFLLDVSRLACECGYLDVVCRTLLAELDNVPGDARTSVAFISYDSAVHFYSLAEGQGQPHQMTVVDIDGTFLQFTLGINQDCYHSGFITGIVSSTVVASYMLSSKNPFEHIE